MTNNVYMQRGDTFKPFSKDTLNLHDSIPAGTYTVSLTEEGYFLKRIENMEMPPKLYGETARYADRIMRTFADRPHTTGVLLSGDKGSGKTLLAKELCRRAISEGMIAISINEPHCGEQFNIFMQSIQQPAVVLFDEFEKIYDDRDKQKQMLTLLDGAYPSKKMFVLTCNDRWQIDEHMRNRPGRLYYAIDYRTLSTEFIIEYCKDNLKNQSHIKGVEIISKFFSRFSFDMLKALVEEMNRYDETAAQAITMLNMKPSDDEASRYRVELFYEGKPVQHSSTSWDNDLDIEVSGVHVEFNPMNFKQWSVVFRQFDESNGKPDRSLPVLKEHLPVLVSPSTMTEADPHEGTFTFRTQHKGYIVKFCRQKQHESAIDYSRYL